MYKVTKETNIFQENMYSIYGKIEGFLYNKYIKNIVRR